MTRADIQNVECVTLTELVGEPVDDRWTLAGHEQPDESSSCDADDEPEVDCWLLNDGPDAMDKDTKRFYLDVIKVDEALRGWLRVAAESTKGKRDARAELHPVVIDHLRTILSFEPMASPWPASRTRLWADFRSLKEAAGLDFQGAFYRLWFGFANASVDNVPADVLQRLMLHRAAATTQGYINKVRRMQRQGTVDRLHVPATFAGRKASGG